MPFSLNDVLLGFALPALWAGGVFAVLSRFSPEDALRRFGPSVGLVGGFLLGYFLLKLGPAVPDPDNHWHWLPFAMLLPLITGPVSQAKGVSGFESILLSVLVAAVAGWWLVPDWEALDPSRATHLIVWGALVVVLIGVTEPLSRRFSGTIFGLVLFITMTFAAAVLALSGILRFAQMAGAGAGALAGLALACRFGSEEANSLPGLAGGFVLLCCGSLLIGQVNSFSDIPLASYLLVPLAPTSLWLFVRGPLSRWEGTKGFLARAGLPLIISAIALVLAAAAEL